MEVVLDGSWIFFFSSRRRHTRLQGDWSSDVCSSDLPQEKSSPAPSSSSSVTCAFAGIPSASPTKSTSTSSTTAPSTSPWRALRSEERRVGKSVDLGGRRIIKKKKRKTP